VQQQVGDFLVATKLGIPAYQLAVVVDDARQGVTDVVRGDDLLSSAARQIWVYRLLNLGPPPRYWHLPLVCGEDGRRLAKRHGDTRLAWYRETGINPRRVVGLLASWAGAGERREMNAREFARVFDVTKLSKKPVLFTPDEQRWLLQKD
jgi:glutamyl-tRNA synthetase